MKECKYCETELNATGHSSGGCNGWTCPICGHEEPEMGSYSLSGRPDVDLNCYCNNCELRRRYGNSIKTLEADNAILRQRLARLVECGEKTLASNYETSNEWGR